MQSQMMYAGERSAAREMETEMMARDQKQMGCSPLGRFISRVFMRRGRQGRMRGDRMDYGAMAYPTAQTCYVRPAAAFSTATANAHAMRPEPLQAHAVAVPGAPYGAASPRGGGSKRKKKKKSKNKRVRFAPAGAEPVPTDAPPPHGHLHAPAAAAASGGSAGHPPHQQHYYPSAATATASAGAEPYSTSTAAAHGHGGRYACAASPLARWEMLGASSAGTPRRYEYFSGEYRWYYPTPVREGIYGLATDANRLTAIFSEENPNACAIV
ncbi:uncharacterized protein LOC102712642 [Oryza brachyantha]|uniref:uncharacterized protein LOC102712642 n=1 Tax=Oryza brachyantha TaxID=4533 RepID=UPI001ADAB71E|nr:uncharacterized protein LOC102712642 [Oryza brachyantha]